MKGLIDQESFENSVDRHVGVGVSVKGRGEVEMEIDLPIKKNLIRVPLTAGKGSRHRTIPARMVLKP